MAKETGKTNAISKDKLTWKGRDVQVAQKVYNGKVVDKFPWEKNKPTVSQKKK